MTLASRQSKFAKDTLEISGMINSNSFRSPQDLGMKLIKPCLKQVASRRTDGKRALHDLRRMLHVPHGGHWQALKGVIRYINGTRTHGIEFKQVVVAASKATRMQNKLAT